MYIHTAFKNMYPHPYPQACVAQINHLFFFLFLSVEGSPDFKTCRSPVLDIAPEVEVLFCSSRLKQQVFSTEDLAVLLILKSTTLLVLFLGKTVVIWLLKKYICKNIYYPQVSLNMSAVYINISESEAIFFSPRGKGGGLCRCRRNFLLGIFCCYILAKEKRTHAWTHFFQ